MMVMMVVMSPMAMVVSVSVVTVLMIVLMLMLRLMSLVVMLMPLAETMPFVFVLMYHSCSGRVCPIMYHKSTTISVCHPSRLRVCRLLRPSLS